MQEGGIISPNERPFTLTQEETATSPATLYLKSMSLSSTSSHGTASLQTRFIATFVPVSPVMFLNFTLLISTSDGACNKFKLSHIHRFYLHHKLILNFKKEQRNYD